MLVSFFLWPILSILADCPIPINNPLKVTSQIRLAQFNAEWLFMTPCQEYGCPWTNETEQTEHIQHIQEIIRELNPDILHLAEIDTCEVLDTVSSFDPSYQSYLIEGKDTATHQNVGLVTRITPLTTLYRTEERVAYPIPISTCNYTGTETGTTGVSKHMITEFVFSTPTQNISIAFIGAHLLAYPTDTLRCIEREAQSQILQFMIVDYIHRGFEIIVLGDFNDFDGEIPDSNGHQPISSVLDILKGSAGSHKGEYLLVSVGDKITSTTRFSDWYDENHNCKSTSTEFSQIDHILLSNFLYDKLEKVFMYQSYEQICGSLYSDHYPIVADFYFEE